MDEPKDGTEETQEAQNEASTPEDVAAIKAQLDAEQKAKSALEQAVAEKDAAISDLEAKRSGLETSLSEAKRASEAITAALKEARDQAVAKYRDMAKTLNPTIPQDIIAGETIAEIDASIEKGKALVASVKQYLEAEAAAAKVPAELQPEPPSPSRG